MDTAQIDAWLEPLPEDTTGPDLEYDPSFLELDQAASGRPETQFGPAEPPSWPTALELSQGLFERTRDLRVAMIWGRAHVNLHGLEGLAPALTLLHGLLDRFWEQLHPRPDPDDGDTFARLSILGSLDSLDGLLGDVRQAPLIVDRRMGGLRMRDVEITLDRLARRDDEALPPSPAQIEGMLGDLPELADRLRQAVEGSLQALKQLQVLMNDRFGIERAVDVKTLRGMLTALQPLIPAEGSAEAAGEPADADADGNGAAGEGAPAASTRRGATSGVHSVESRQDAVRAINLICAYLERSEPTNPAQLLLRRAERLIDKNFLQLVHDFAPDAVRDVARILGIDPDSLSQESY